MLAANDPNGTSRPGLILAHPDPYYVAKVSRTFGRLNWSVHVARNSEEVRRFARDHEPEMIVLASELGGESGWLTCEKLTSEFPQVKIVLVVEESTLHLQHFAEFVGASALVSTNSALAALLDLARPAAVV